MTITTSPPTLDIDPFSDEVLVDPYGFHEQLREAGPVARLSAHDAYAIGRYEQVRNALRDHDAFVSGRGVGLDDFAQEKPWRTPSLLLETDPPKHSTYRAAMGSIVNPRTVRALRTAFTGPAEKLADELVERGRFDAVTDLAEAFPLTVFPQAVGIRPGGHEHLLAYGSIAFNAVGPRNHLLEAALAAAPPTMAWIDDSCARDALDPAGFGAAVWSAADRGDIPVQDAPLLVRSFLSAGIDTTVHALGNTMHALAVHPEAWAAVHAEPGRVRFAFDEALRWEAPVQTFCRTTVTDVEIDGSVIPADAKVLLSYGAANRDPRRWGPTAHRFELDRSSGGHLAFGMGIHQCVGQPIARLEAELILGALARRAARIELDGDPVPKLNNALLGWSSLPVRVVSA
ncbi:cytochrome P450 [Pseudonocardia xishanensis]|uniref:Cytochrome P450 n=1 Tax=Pseudonocardia xishanensis TaxID=630995 RepID=A0ABP8RDG8_9PSEU